MAQKRYRQIPLRGDPHVTLQMSDEMYEQLTKWAKYNARTVRAEIIARMTQMMYLQHREFEEEAKLEKIKRKI